MIDVASTQYITREKGMPPTPMVKFSSKDVLSGFAIELSELTYLPGETVEGVIATATKILSEAPLVGPGELINVDALRDKIREIKETPRQTVEGSV
ncbi:MAG: hypothetical protein AAB580_03450 [Patescibacteria group bacterium]